MLPVHVYSAKLRAFGRNVVWPAVPVGLWLMLGLAAFSGVNLVFQREIWPHYPQAHSWFIALLGVSGCSLPWLVGQTARRVSLALTRWWWRGLWQLFAALCYGVTAVASLLFLIGLIIYSG